jgi:hypothetical protein
MEEEMPDRGDDDTEVRSIEVGPASVGFLRKQASTCNRRIGDEAWMNSLSSAGRNIEKVQGGLLYWCWFWFRYCLFLDGLQSINIWW